jgi:hypothetical protein
LGIGAVWSGVVPAVPRGISTGDVQEALSALPDKRTPSLSPSAIARLKGHWQADYERWQKRDLPARRYV